MDHKGGGIVDIFKGQGDVLDPDAGRGIWISKHVAKFLPGTLFEMIKPAYEASQPGSQLGGRAKRSTPMGQHGSRLLSGVAERLGRSWAKLFIDIQKGFDKIVKDLGRLERIWEGLLGFGWIQIDSVERCGGHTCELRPHTKPA